MAGKRKEITLSRGGLAVFELSDDKTRLQIEITTKKSGLTKTDVNVLLRALEAVRDKMERG
jgi:hypothetical protein